MAIWPFNRKKSINKSSKIPEEVQQYYQAEHRERMGLAWLIAFLTLVVTVLIVLGLFLGSRWLYRKINKPNQPQTTQTVPKKEQTPGPKQIPKTQEKPAGSTGSNQPQTPAAGPQPSTTPNTGPGSTLLNTGPDGDY